MEGGGSLSVLHLGCRCCFLIGGTDLFLMSGGDAVHKDSSTAIDK